MGHQKVTELEFTSKDGRKFSIRGDATRGDLYEMHSAMANGVEIENGKIIRTNSSKLYPWLIERFVEGGKKTLDDLMNEPADPAEDLIMVLGAFVFNHVKGLTVSAESEGKKKD